MGSDKESLCVISVFKIKENRGLAQIALDRPSVLRGYHNLTALYISADSSLLFHCHTLGKVTRFIHVTSAVQGSIVSDQLRWDD